MILTYNEIKEEHSFGRAKETFEDYINNHFYPVYDHALNFVGYRRNGDYEERHGGIY